MQVPCAGSPVCVYSVQCTLYTKTSQSKVLIRVPRPVQSFGVTGLPFWDLLYIHRLLCWVRSPFTGSPARRLLLCRVRAPFAGSLALVFPLLCQHRLRHLTALLPFYNVYISVLFIVNLNKRQKDLFLNFATFDFLVILHSPFLLLSKFKSILRI